MRTCLILVLVGWACAGFPSHCNARGVPAQYGLDDFGQVNKQIYRGGQPNAEGVRRLHAIGIKTIISLRSMTSAASKTEAVAAHASGIVFTNFPMKGLGRPTEQQVQKVLDFIESAPAPIYIHCRCGADRVSLIVACYRIRHDHWQTPPAMEEAVRYGLSVWERGMRKFIISYGKAVTPVLKANRPPLNPTVPGKPNQFPQEAIQEWGP